MEILAYQAKEAHRQVTEHSACARRYRTERNKIIRELYKTGKYSYGKIARSVGCSSELIAKVIQGR